MEILTKSTIDRRFGYYKYVRFEGDVFKFIEVTSLGNHSDMVTEGEEAWVISAGTIKIRDNQFDMDGWGSHTLKRLGLLDEPMKDDIEVLEKVLGMKNTIFY